MSKKLAEGIDGLVLDVKTGNGAFMERLDDSMALARAMVAIGRGLGKKMRALITRMDQPLGRAVGNAVEIAESVECLRGHGPADLMDLSVELAAEMVLMGEVASTLEEARERCWRTIADGSALAHFRKVVAAQGGDPHAIDDPSRLPQPWGSIEVDSKFEGYVHALAARPIGQATMLLGAGRARVDSRIDPSVGVILHKKVGDRVEAGEPLCTVLVNGQPGIEVALAMIGEAYRVEPGPVTVEPLIVDRI
jgi:pyrimidine-nucleoside phosphorylase